MVLFLFIIKNYTRMQQENLVEVLLLYNFFSHTHRTSYVAVSQIEVTFYIVTPLMTKVTLCAF